MKEQNGGFRDPTVLVRCTQGFLCAYIAVLLVNWIWGWDLWNGSGPPDELLLVLTLVLVITAILVLMWTHRANFNAHQLGVADMRFTPGWAVGWYFIPIAWFWKPYQVMREIWQASGSPASWEQEGRSSLAWWWGLWIWSFGVRVVYVTRYATGTVTAEEAIVHPSGKSIFVAIGSALLLLQIIEKVHQMQMGRHQAHDEADPHDNTSSNF